MVVRFKRMRNACLLLRHSLFDEGQAARDMLVRIRRRKRGTALKLEGGIAISEVGLIDAVATLLEDLLANEGGYVLVLDGDDNMSGPQMAALMRQTHVVGAWTKQKDAERSNKDGIGGETVFFRVRSILERLPGTSWRGRPVPPSPRRLDLTASGQAEARTVLVELLRLRDTGSVRTSRASRIGNPSLGPAILLALCDLISVLARTGRAHLFSMDAEHLSVSTKPARFQEATIDTVPLMEKIRATRSSVPSPVRARDANPR